MWSFIGITDYQAPTLMSYLEWPILKTKKFVFLSSFELTMKGHFCLFDLNPTDLNWLYSFLKLFLNIKWAPVCWTLWWPLKYLWPACFLQISLHLLTPLPVPVKARFIKDFIWKYWNENEMFQENDWYI